jgi:integrase
MTKRHTPKYRRQRRPNSTDQAFVEIHGHRHYLGPFDSPASRQAYHRLVADLDSNDGILRPSVSDCTIDDLIQAFFAHAKAYYRHADGSPTSELQNIRLALRRLRSLHGSSLAADFGPRALKTLQQHMVNEHLARGYINRTMGRIRRMFRWAVSEELLDASVYHALQSVPGLKKGRSAARETGPVQPVPQHLIAAIEPLVSRPVWALIQLQLTTAARPGELVIMRPIDLDMSEPIWTYAPTQHKNAYRDHDRSIFIGPQGQETLQPFLTGRSVDAFLFSPLEAESERRAHRADQRRTPLSCGNRTGTNRVATPCRSAGPRYTTTSYARAIARACEMAFPIPSEILAEADDEIRVRLTAEWRRDHRWSPHQLRHNAATTLRREYGLEVAQVMLGHARADVTQVYAAANRRRGKEIAAQFG